LIGRYRSAVERKPDGGYMIARPLAPSRADLVEIEERAQAIQAGMSPTAAETVERRMAKLFLMFPMVGLAGDNGKAAIEAYAGILRVFPLWAIDRACQKVITSGATFRPSGPEIRKLVEAECRPIYEELDVLRVITTAEIYEPQAATERDRIKGGYAEIKAFFDGARHQGRKTREEAERDVASGFAHLRGPIAIGDTLRAAMGART
jgi:hypothetical protein